MFTDLILGTAGHIDHGKSSLIRALTGCDTDRLPEEKRRGITIDLGFAHLVLGSYRLGIVDVPGHERFVRNMLAGATGMDLALLVVAADDSVKPQTIEHLQILKLLKLPAGVIALTKSDLVDADWLELVREEIRELVAGTFLEDTPIVATSITTGEGINELRDRLATAAEHAARCRADRFQAPFRMAIDRAFTVQGHGVVVTGSVGSGRVAVGEELELQPGGSRVRVRGLQHHDVPTDAVQRGQRAALNLAGVRLEQLARGQELAAVGHLRPTRLLTVQLHLDSLARPLKNRTRCRIHLGAAEFLGHVRLLFDERLEPGRISWAQLHLELDAVAVWRQPFVLRSESPVTTIGGGVVVDPLSNPLRRPSPAERSRLESLLSSDPFVRSDSICYLRGLRDIAPADFYSLAGIETPAPLLERLLAERVVETVPISITRTQLVHREVLDRVGKRIESALGRLHEAHPLCTSFEASIVQHLARFHDAEPLFHYLVQRADEQEKIRVRGNRLGLAGRGPQLSQNEARLLNKLIVWVREAGMAPPSVQEIQARATKNLNSVPQLLAIAKEQGDLIPLDAQHYLHVDVERQARTVMVREFGTRQGFTVSQVRELLGTTRKYAVPYCEYLDRMGVTRRDGDLRYLTASPALNVS
jgi:selenocysteine-specific elongation factor